MLMFNERKEERSEPSEEDNKDKWKEKKEEEMRGNEMSSAGGAKKRGFPIPSYDISLPWKIREERK